jgi:hypothetical protein
LYSIPLFLRRHPKENRCHVLTINSRLIIPIVLCAILGGYAGHLIAEEWSGSLPPHGILVGAVAGGLLGFTIGLYLQQQKRRWIAAAILTFLLILAYAIGGPWDALLAAASVFIAFFTSAAILRELYGGDEITAFKHHLRILFAARGEWLIVENGKVVIPKGKGPHLGPLRVVVKPGNAIVMEAGSKITRICGPAIFQSNNYEYVKDILETTRLRRTAAVSDALTRELVPVIVDITYIYGVDVSDETIRGENGSVTHADGSQGLTADELNTLRDLVTTMPTWQQDIHSIVSAAIREVVAGQTYSDLVGRRDYMVIESLVHAGVRRRTNFLSIRVDSLRITRVSPASEILEALSEGERVRTREQAAGDAWRLAMTAIAAGYRAATGGQNMSPSRLSEREQSARISSERYVKTS